MNPRDLRRMLALIVATLLGFGCIAVYSSTALLTYETRGSACGLLGPHLAAIAIGLAAALACWMIPYAALRRAAKLVVLASIVLLVLVRVLGMEVGGAQRWFRFGAFSLQPSEFAQLALVIYLADFL